VTALCGGAPSASKPGVDRYINMTAFAAGALLNNIPTKWAVPLAAALGARTYDMTQFCTTDPPALPNITAADAVNILSHLSTPLEALSSIEKLADLVEVYLWHQLCNCVGVATPDAPLAPAQPTDWPAFDPGYLPQPVASRCATRAKTTQYGPYPVNRGGNWDIFVTDNTNQLAPALNTNTNALPLPTSCTSITVTQTHYSVTGDTLLTGDTQLIVYNSTGSAVGSIGGATFSDDARTRPAGQAVTKTGTLQVPSTAVSYRAVPHWSSNTDTGYGVMTWSVDFFCGGQTLSTPIASCCPPDPGLAQQINQVLDLVTLIQRQIVPFAVIDGTVHDNVSGNGTFAISSALIGLKIEVTTAPSRHGVLVGSPDHVYDVGEVSLGDADGWFYTRRADRLAIVWTPKDAQLATLIGYTIPADTVVRITELKREA
jgi:hypothetical protein